MILAFDIDGTWTEDPSRFRRTYDLFDEQYQCLIVTGREQPPEKLRRLLVPVDAIVIVSGPLLKEEAVRRAGYTGHIVWIDDMPGTIQRTAIIEVPHDDSAL